MADLTRTGAHSSARRRISTLVSCSTKSTTSTASSTRCGSATSPGSASTKRCFQDRSCRRKTEGGEQFLLELQYGLRRGERLPENEEHVFRAVAEGIDAGGRQAEWG